tara:strand:- start:106 stop:510 length:405 start_codon:yes stop_codon:yes gene_type:complete
MPSNRKRIGYLPSPKVQELITQIAHNEKLSQSKVVGLLVEEALFARGIFKKETENHLRRSEWAIDKSNIDNLTSNYDEIDELISDKGITYNKKDHKTRENKPDFLFNVSKDKVNTNLFKQYKQFLLSQKMPEEE